MNSLEKMRISSSYNSQTYSDESISQLIQTLKKVAINHITDKQVSTCQFHRKVIYLAFARARSFQYLGKLCIL